MTTVAPGFTRVRMVRHEFVSEGWASVYRGRLLSGNIYDVPNEDANGKPIASRWVHELGIARPSAATMTTREAEIALGIGVEGAGAPSHGVAPDGPVAPGLSDAQILHAGDLPPGGMPELSAADAARAEATPGAFSAAELERPASEIGEADDPVFNRVQLANLAAAGYVTPEQLDAAPDDVLLTVPGIGPKNLQRYRDQRASAATTGGRRGQPGPLVGQ